MSQRAAAILSFAAPFAVFTSTLQSVPGFWDTGELQVVTYILGIAHPTGFPLYTLVGYVASHVPLGEVPARTALLSAICISLSAAAAYAVSRRLGAEMWIASASGLVFAAGSTAWLTATRTDVHPMVLVFETASFLFALESRLFFSAACFGLGLATHPIALLTLPALLVLVLPRARGLSTKSAIALVAIPLLVLGLYLYFPLRSAYVDSHHLDPSAALGFVPGAGLFWNYANPSTPAGFLRLVTGSDFDRASGMRAIFELSGLLPRILRFGTTLLREYGWLVCALATLGAGACLARRKTTTLVALLLFGYLPAMFGLGYAGQGFLERYILPAFWTLAVLAGFGMSSLAGIVRERRLRALGALVALAAALALLRAHYPAILPKSDEAGAARLALGATVPGSIVVAPWARATVLGYEIYVAHDYGNRIILAGSVDSYDRTLLRQWLEEHPLYAVDAPSHFRLAGFWVREVESAPHVVEILKEEPVFRTSNAR